MNNSYSQKLKILKLFEKVRELYDTYPDDKKYILTSTLPKQCFISIRRDTEKNISSFNVFLLEKSEVPASPELKRSYKLEPAENLLEKSEVPAQSIFIYKIYYTFY